MSSVSNLRSIVKTPLDGVSEAATPKRLSTAKQIDATRERMTSTTGTRREFDYGLLRNFAENRNSSSLAITFLTLIATFALMFTLIQRTDTGFAAMLSPIAGVLTLLAHLLNVLAARSLLKKPIQEVKLADSTRRFILLDCFYGLAWAAYIPVIWLSKVQIDSIMIILALIIIAGSTMIASPLPKAVYGATLPITVALCAYFIMKLTAEGFILTGCILVAEGFFLFIASRFYSANLSGIVSSAEKESLLADLEFAKIASDNARKEAERANIAKSSFLAQMSHELRTPLNAILGFSEVIKDELFGKLGVPSYKDYANDIHSSGKHLLSLINEILDLSRIESGKQELTEDAVMLSYIAEDAVHLLRVRAKSKGVELVEKYEEEMPKIWGDERAIRQILLNLMSNAIKFTPNDGKVTVTVGWTASGGQYVSIKDTGMGIPEDEIADVLSNFGQGSNAAKLAEAGTGLGLPIVQGLVQMHGGTFTLRSKVNVGTEVIATFPAERVLETLTQIKSPSIVPQSDVPKERINIRRQVTA